MKIARTYTNWGTVEGTKAASIDVVLMEATHRMTISGIENEILRRGGQLRGAVSSHLNTLKNRGVIDNKQNGWGRPELV